MNSTHVELVISVVTLIAAWFIGNKSVWGQRFGMVANLAWWFYVLEFQRYGLVPMEIMFSIMQIRNLIKWERENNLQ